MAMKPRTAAVVAVSGVLVLGVGGTIVYNSVSDSKDTGTAVEWWVPDWDYDVAVTLVEQFNEVEPDIQVELVKTTGDTVANRTAVALDSGAVPDLITDSIARVPTYVAKGQLEPLSELYDDKMPTSDFAPGLLESLSIDGDIYALPYRWATNALIYNPELFEKAGLSGAPETWDEFVTYAEKLTDGDVVGTAWPMSGEPSDLTLRFVDFAVSGGSTITAGTPTLSDSSVSSALDLLGTSVAEGWASPSSFELDNTGIRELFLQGRIAMYPGGLFDVTEALGQGAPIATALLPGPDGPGTAQGVGWAHIIPKASDNKDDTKVFAAFLGESDNMAALTATFPARKSAAENERFQTPELQAFAEQLSNHSVPAINDPRWTAIVPSVHNQIQEVALGRKSVQDATSEIMTLSTDAMSKE